VDSALLWEHFLKTVDREFVGLIKIFIYLVFKNGNFSKKRIEAIWQFSGC
jgi:hypothetical protein